MKARRDIIKTLEAGKVQLRQSFIFDRGRVLEFSVQLEVYRGRHWSPVVRYDTAHEEAHKDILDHKGGLIQKIWLNMEFREAMAYAMADLVNHWRSYVGHSGGRNDE